MLSFSYRRCQVVISHSESLFIVEGEIAREAILGDGLAGDSLFPRQEGRLYLHEWS